MWVNYIFLSLGWIGYGLLHSALATTKVKNLFFKVAGKKENIYRVFYNIIAVLTIIPLIYFGFYHSGLLLLPMTVVLRIVAIVFLSVGLSVMIVIIKKYFVQMSGVADENNNKLHTAGLHGFVRHPLYSGTFIFLAGVFFLIPQLNVLISVLCIMLYTIFAVGWEEKKLLIQLGDQYSVYCSTTPRFIPRFFARRKDTIT